MGYPAVKETESYTDRSTQAELTTDPADHPAVAALSEAEKSKFNYYAGYITTPAINLWLISRAFSSGNEHLRPLTMILLTVTAYLFWTQVEYWMHRIPYHRGESRMKTGHSAHHEEPEAYLGLPYYYHGGAYIVVYLLLSRVLPAAGVGLFMGVFGFGHLSYNVMHHMFHHGYHWKNSFFRTRKAHHAVHHRHPDKNFSVTFPLWDRVFGTSL